jgi:hypothetical protein
LRILGERPGSIAKGDTDRAMRTRIDAICEAPNLDDFSITTSNQHIMDKIQVRLSKEELDALRKAAARSGRSVAELVRDAIREIVLKPQAIGPVAIWDGEPKRTSFAHDTVHDELRCGKGRRTSGTTVRTSRSGH